jgi:hypothetical protein
VHVLALWGYTKRYDIQIHQPNQCFLQQAAIIHLHVLLSFELCAVLHGLQVQEHMYQVETALPCRKCMQKLRTLFIELSLLLQG